MDQYLVDYTVRNITTGDGEEMRVLELTVEEVQRFPADTVQSIGDLLAEAHTRFAVDGPAPLDWSWEETLESIRQALLPYISDPVLYHSSYSAWESNVLSESYTGEVRLLDVLPPEDITDRVRAIALGAVDGALENWDEGYWQGWTTNTTRRNVLTNLAGYLLSLAEMPDEDDEELGQPIHAMLEADA